MKLKLRRRKPVPQLGDDLTSILAALEANNPDDAAAAKTAQVEKRQADDLASILAALESNNPEDAAAAKQAPASLAKRQEDLKSILAALKANSPEDANAAAALSA
jgi:hypothetical protein